MSSNRILEWPTPEHLESFLKSGLRDLIEVVKPVITGPPTIELYETNTDAQSLLDTPIMDILDVKPNEGNSNITALAERVAAGLSKLNGSGSVHGSSVNLDQGKVVIIRGFKDRAVSSRIAT
jgi:hypothetical protein